jgi:hypothetical protein
MLAPRTEPNCHEIFTVPAIEKWTSISGGRERQSREDRGERGARGLCDSGSPRRVRHSPGVCYGGWPLRPNTVTFHTTSTVIPELHYRFL